MTWEPDRVRDAMHDYDRLRGQLEAALDGKRLAEKDASRLDARCDELRELARDLWARLRAADEADDGAWIDARMAERVAELGVE